MKGQKRKHVLDPADERQLLSPLAIRGRLSASEVQQYAASAIKSGASGEDLINLAKLGGNGSSLNNAHRDLARAFFRDMVAPEAVQVAIVLKVKNSMGAVEEAKKDVPVILPHHWVEALEQKNMLEHLTCSRESLEEFWRKQDWDHNPQLQNWKKF